MKTNIYLSCIFLIFCLGSCGDDKAAAAKQDPIADAQTAKQRATENIQVTLPDGTKQNKPTPVKTQDYNPNSPNKGQSKMQEQIDEKLKKSLAHYGKLLPSACELVSPAFVAQVIGGDVDPTMITVKDGSGKNAVDAKACFFKWDDQGNPNGGVLIQVQRNAIPDEFPDWAAYYINGRINQGDQSADGSVTYRYKKFPGMGVAGAYNYDLARYTWRTETDHVFMVAFNLESSEAEQLIWAEKLGKMAMEKFNSLNR